jgi:hypothetical protein
MLKSIHEMREQSLNPLALLTPVAAPGDHAEIRGLAHAAQADDAVPDYLLSIVRQSRSLASLTLGASPRAGVMLLHAAKALAVPRGRDYLTPDEVQGVAYPVLRHRIRLTPEAEIEGLTPDACKIDRREEFVRRPRRVPVIGMEFESLRPYVAGDDPRQIDWKATARRATLISRNRQVEKGQQIAVLIDSGRLMADGIDGLTKLDHALNAAILLGHVTQKRGDTFAAACFSNRLESFLPAVRGAAIMPHGGTELLAICLSGAAGYLLAGAIVAPGLLRRADALKQVGGQALVIEFGCMFMVVVAGLIEGFVSPSTLGFVPRILVLAATLSLWAAYFVLAGRPRTESRTVEARGKKPNAGAPTQYSQNAAGSP